MQDECSFKLLFLIILSIKQVVFNMSTDTSDPNKPWIVTIGFDAPENPTSSTPTSLKESVVKVNDEQEEKEHREFTEMLEKLEASGTNYSYEGDKYLTFF